MLNRSTTLAAAVAAVGLAGHASAQLIAADSFVTDGNANTYNDNANIGGQTSSVGITGFSGAWSSGSANIQPDLVTLTQPPVTDAYAAGGKGVYVASSFDFYRSANHALDSYAQAGEYWMSFLVNPGGSFGSAGSSDGRAVVGFTNFYNSATFNNDAGSANLFGLSVGYKGTGAGGPDDFDLVMYARDGSGDAFDFVLNDTPVANETSLVLLKVTPQAGPDVVDYWVNPSDASSEAALDLTAAQMGSYATFAFNTPGDVDRLSVTTSDWSRTFFYDEPRFAYDLASVAAIPEPTTAGVLALAAGGFLVRRRR